MTIRNIITTQHTTYTSHIKVLRTGSGNPHCAIFRQSHIFDHSGRIAEETDKTRSTPLRIRIRLHTYIQITYHVPPTVERSAKNCHRLCISGITSNGNICWRFYGDMAVGNAVWVIPQMLILMLGILWALAVTYMYPMMVTYQMNFRTIIRNSFILAVGRLPGSVGIRLLHCVPTVLFTVIFLLTLQPWVLMLLFAYYLIFGFAFSRFITASFTNAVFDKYINSRIEGAQVNRGLSQENDDDDDDDDEQEEERELKPWENGYTDKH